MNQTAAPQTGSFSWERPTVWNRLRMWWQATGEIVELTREPTNDDRAWAEAAIRLTPDYSHLARLLWRRRG